MSSSIEDPNPKGGDGPNRGEQSGVDKVSGASGEHRQDEGHGHQGHGERGRLHDDDASKTASKGINPVQHSE
jgi:hypothetical protein